MTKLRHSSPIPLPSITSSIDMRPQSSSSQAAGGRSLFYSILVAVVRGEAVVHCSGQLLHWAEMPFIMLSATWVNVDYRQRILLTRYKSLF